ncbi:MAG: response regulator [Gaiellaceae bacterium]
MTVLPRVLVVEDSPAFRGLVASHLRRLGATFAVAEDVPAAIVQLERSDFDLFLTDFQLQAATGLDLLAFVRHRFPLLPVVVMSALVDADLRRQAASADGVYDKQQLLGVLPALVHGAPVAA